MFYRESVIIMPCVLIRFMNFNPNKEVWVKRKVVISEGDKRPEKTFR